MYFYLKKPNGKSNTLIYLKYYISEKEGRFVYSTSQNITPGDWNFKNKNVKTIRGRNDIASIEVKIKPYSDLLNTLLSNYNLNDVTITKKQLKIDFDKRFGLKNNKIVIPTFLELIKLMIKRKKEAKKITTGTEKKYNTLKTNLLLFEKDTKTTINYDTFHVEGEFVENWLKYCYNTLNHTDNTVGRSLSFIKTVLLYGKQYHNLTEFSHLKKFTQETDDIALTLNELMTYFNHDFKQKKYLERVRDVFCIGCFTGQRFSDYSVFNKLDYKNGKIERRAKKTKIKVIIPVDDHKNLKYLLEKYDWNLPKISEQKFRDYLKEGLKLTEKLDYDIKKTSYKGVEVIETIKPKYKFAGSHTARRTFITLALEHGWTYKEIMTVAGIKEVATVIKYDKVNSQRLSKKIKNTFG